MEPSNENHVMATVWRMGVGARRHLFRTWAILSLLWVAIVTAISLSEHSEQFDPVTSVRIEVEAASGQEELAANRFFRRRTSDAPTAIYPVAEFDTRSSEFHLARQTFPGFADQPDAVLLNHVRRLIDQRASVVNRERQSSATEAITVSFLGSFGIAILILLLGAFLVRLQARFPIQSWSRPTRMLVALGLTWMIGSTVWLATTNTYRAEMFVLVEDTGDRLLIFLPPLAVALASFAWRWANQNSK